MRKYVLRFVVAAALFVALLLPLSPGAHGADLGTERSVFEFLTTELGLNSAAACGVLANIEAESNFILTSYGDGGTSYGLCQWHDGRFDALQSFCLLQGYDYWSLEGQLNYLAYELRTRYQSTYAALRRVANTSDGAYEAGYAWCVNFEVPANREEKGVIRGRTAQFKYWLRYGDSSSDFSASVGITSNGYNSSLSDWPDTSSSFYWEAEENQAEPTAPISTPSSASQVPAPPGKPKRLLSPPAGFLNCGMSPIICPALSLALRPPLQNSLALPWRACSSAPESPPNATACPSLKRKNLNPANDLQINCLLGSAALAADPDSIERQGIQPWMNKRNPLKRSRTKRRSRTRSPMSPGPNGKLLRPGFF